jgi:hypothetical protein
MENCYENTMMAAEFRKSNEGKRLGEYIELLNKIASVLLNYHKEETCCSEYFRHFEFQCPSNREHVIATYHTWNYAHLGMEEVEQFVIFMAAYELYTFIDEHETCPIASQFKVFIANILDLCILEFNENIYVVDTRKRAAKESSNILQEEDDKSLSLGMPVQPQEDDENISLEEEECEEEIEKDIFQPKLLEELDLPTSPSTNDSNTQIQKSFVIYENPCYDECETNNAPLLSINTTSELIDDNEEYCLNMLYDNALDDGPTLIDKPPCLVVTKFCEDKNDILAVCDGTLTHESPTLFLNSPNYTIEEKFAYVEKYLCGLQLPLVPNLCCNHDIKLNIDIINYFERGKHANEFHNKFNNPLYVPKLSKLNDSCGYMVEFISTTCNYYERGGDKNPLYVTNNYMLQVNIVNMHWETSIYGDSFIYKMPMHRKKVRLRCYYFCVLFFSLLGFNLTIILIGLKAPWDPGIIHEHFPRKRDTSKFKFLHELRPL